MNGGSWDWVGLSRPRGQAAAITSSRKRTDSAAPVPRWPLAVNAGAKDKPSVLASSALVSRYGPKFAAEWRTEQVPNNPATNHSSHKKKKKKKESKQQNKKKQKKPSILCFPYG